MTGWGQRLYWYVSVPSLDTLNPVLVEEQGRDPEFFDERVRV